MEPDNVELVRRLWEAFERGGIDAVLEIADPDVEWEPYAGGGIVYRGHAGLRGYIEGRAANNEEIDARLYSAVANGDLVVARGEVRIRGPEGIVTMQPGWLYEFRQAKLIRFRGYPSHEAALRAAGLAREDAASIVRDLWAGFNRHGVDGMFEFIHHDAEWHTYLGADNVYYGHEGIRRYYDEVAGTAKNVTVVDYAVREIGDAILVSGSLQALEPKGAVAQRQVHWVYWVEGGKVRRAASFAHREQAEKAAREGVAARAG